MIRLREGTYDSCTIIETQHASNGNEIWKRYHKK